MKTRLSLIIAVLSVVMMTGCVSSDKEVEAVLNGTWETTYEEKEDGMTLIGKETLVLNASDHTCQTTLRISMHGYGEYYYIGEIKVDGTWKASKSELEYNWDKNQLYLNISSDFDDAETRSTFQEFIDENNGKIDLISFSADTFTIKDGDGDKSVYSRID